LDELACRWSVITDRALSKRDVVEELRHCLGRPFEMKGLWIVQTCPICEVELRLMEMSVESENLAKELFSLFDDHRCRARATEDMFQRAERESVRRGERALALAREAVFDQTRERLAARAEKESLALACWVDSYLKNAA
jgi:hypothetical protein